MVAFLFPGQGSQSAGMGKALAEKYAASRRAFEEADDALSMSLTKLCFEGPDDELKKTEITQPAILATSIAALRALETERPDLKPEVVAGHSLGEITALVAAGAIAFGDALRVVRERGRLMQQAVPIGEGAMAAVMGLAPEIVRDACSSVSSGLVSPANFNSTEQTVISGSKAGVEAAKKVLSEKGAMKIVDLAVSAPFHCALMEPAARGLAGVLEPISVGPLSCAVISNVEAKPNTDPARVKSLLVEQVTSPVRWVEIVQLLVATGVMRAIEIGPSKVLMGLARRIDRNFKVLNVEDPGSLAKTLEALSA
jgi:[acyl-carrier-protein] S-malonyltransferase